MYLVTPRPERHAPHGLTRASTITTGGIYTISTPYWTLSGRSTLSTLLHLTIRLGGISTISTPVYHSRREIYSLNTCMNTLGGIYTISSTYIQFLGGRYTLSSTRFGPESLRTPGSLASVPERMEREFRSRSLPSLRVLRNRVKTMTKLIRVLKVRTVLPTSWNPRFLESIKDQSLAAPKAPIK